MQLKNSHNISIHSNMFSVKDIKNPTIIENSVNGRLVLKNKQLELVQSPVNDYWGSLFSNSVWNTLGIWLTMSLASRLRPNFWNAAAFNFFTK